MKPFSSPSRCAFSLAALLGIGMVVPLLSARAATYTYTWDGGGSDANVTTGTNWQGNAAPPIDGSADVVFTDSLFTSGHTDTTPNLSVNFLVDSLTFAGGSSFTLGSVSSRGLDLGAGGLNQNSTAVQTITVPTFLTVDQTWTFASGAGALNFSGNGVINDQGFALTLAPQGNNVLNGNITGAGALAVNGPGAVTVSGANTYQGGTTLSAGTLILGSSGALGTTGTLTFGGGTLQYGASNQTDYSSRFSTQSNQAFDVNTGGQNITFGTALTSSGGSLTKLGAGMLTLTGASNYTGQNTTGPGTTVSAGTLAVTGSVINGDATLTVDGTSAAAATLSLSGTGSMSVGAANVGYNGSGTVNQVGGSLNTNTIQLTLGNSQGSSGTYTLSGGSLGTGEILVGNAGTGTFIQMGGSVTASSYYSYQSVIFLGGEQGASGTYQLSGASSSLSSNGIVVGSSGKGTFTQTGGSVTTNNGALVLGEFGSSSGTYKLSGAGSSLSTGQIDVGESGVGTFTQTGGSVTTGEYNVNLGDYATGTYTLGGGSLSTSELDIGGQSPGIFTQTGGSVTTNGGELNLGDGEAGRGSGTYNLSGGSLSTGSIFVGAVGTGTFTQTGGSVTTNGNELYVLAYYPGTVATYTLGGGTLTVGSVGAYPQPNYGTGIFHFAGGTLLPAGDSPTIASGMTTFFSGITTADVQTGGAFIDTQTYNVTIAQSLLHDTRSNAPAMDGGLTKLGSGSLTLDATNTYTGTTLVNAGTLNLANQYALENSTLVLGNSGSGIVTFDSSVSANASYIGGLSGSGNLTLANNATTPVAVALTVGANNVDTTYAGVLSGSGSLTKVGTGTLTLTGANTFTGCTTFAGGTINAGSSGALGSSGVLNFTGGTFQFSSANTTDYSARFSTAANQAISLDTNGQNVTLGTTFGAITAGGSGTSLTKLGAGTLTINGANVYTGATYLNGGVLLANNQSALGSGGTISFGGGTLQYGNHTDAQFNNADFSSRFSTTDNQSYSIDTNGHTGIVYASALTSSGGSLTKLGAGTLTLTGTNTYSGGTVVNVGTLEAKYTASLPGDNTPGAVMVNNGATLAANVGGTGEWTEANVNTLLANATFNSGSSLGIDTTDAGGNFNYASNITGNFGLTKLGTGTLTLNGTGNQLTSTTVTAGTLALTGTGALNSTSVAVVGTAAAAPTLALGGTGNPLTATNLFVGFDPKGVYATHTGTVNQTSGTVTTRNVYLDSDNGGTNGTYNLSGTGQLGSITVYVGDVGGGTFNQTGGTLSASTQIYVSDPGDTGTSIYNQSAGTVNTPTLTVGSGASGTYNLSGSGSQLMLSALVVGDGSGTGVFNQTGGLNTVNGTLTLANASGSTGTYKLSGGVLAVNNVTAGSGTGAFDFNGGTLRANAATNSLITAIPYVQAGGAIIDTNGYTVQIPTSIYHDPALGSSTADGGLTKIGLGTLQLAGNVSSYNGGTNINAGTLQLLDSGALGSTGTISFGGGTLQYSLGISTDFSGRFSNAANQAYSVSISGTNVTFASPLMSSGGSLTKLGIGSLTLTASNTYTGPTLVSQGTLLVNGTQSGTGQVTVQNTGSVLGGTGNLAAAVNVTTGALNPGGNTGAPGSSANVGTLKVGALTFSSTGTAVFDVSSSTNYDQVVANGNVSLGGATLTLNESSGATFTKGQILNLIHTSGGSLSGTFAGLSNGSYFDGFTAVYTSTDFELVAVPEPATWLGGALLLGTAAALGLRRLRPA